MVNILVHANDILIFALELAALFLWGRLAYGIFDNKIFKISAAILAVLVFMYIWGNFFSPKANYKLPELLYYISKFLILALPSLQLLKENKMLTFGIFILVGISTIIQWTLGRGEWDMF